MAESFWSTEAMQIMRQLHPGSEVVVVDQREMSRDEAWVCLRAAGRECVLGLRCLHRGPAPVVDVLYLHPQQPGDEGPSGHRSRRGGVRRPRLGPRVADLAG